MNVLGGSRYRPYIYIFAYNARSPSDRTPGEAEENYLMAAYTCEKSGMSVGTMTCGQCGKELVHDTLTTAEGETVHISKCPDEHGKIKSPMCCGSDMACTI